MVPARACFSHRGACRAAICGDGVLGSCLVGGQGGPAWVGVQGRGIIGLHGASVWVGLAWILPFSSLNPNLDHNPHIPSL